MIGGKQENPNHWRRCCDIVIVSGGGDFAGSTLLNGNWKENATVTINFVGTGSVYSTDWLSLS
ncbi:MAG: hypothetical protein ACM3X1_06980 [Ignavibacteriales bacterium]